MRGDLCMAGGGHAWQGCMCGRGDVWHACSPMADTMRYSQ